MKRTIFLLVFLLTIVTVTADIRAEVYAFEGDLVPVIIELSEDIDVEELRAIGVELGYEYEIIDAIAAEVPKDLLEQIAALDIVEEIELDYTVSVMLDESISQIRADEVWERGVEGSDVDVAVLDTGIAEHTAFPIEKFQDFTGEGEGDGHGHGTHVAGTIVSMHERYRGVAPAADIWGVKVLSQYGSGSSSNIIKGIEWAVDNGAEVISMSLGGRIVPCDGTDALSQAVDAAVDAGVVVVVAAGNSGPGMETIAAPGCAKKALTVGAVDKNNEIASFSSRGPTADGRVKPEVVAPGVDIMSTWNDGSFHAISGTSMATPHVSGVVALLLSVDNTLSPESIKNILQGTAVDLGRDENIQGAGIVDAYAAVAPLIEGPRLDIRAFTTEKEVVDLDESVELMLTVKNIGTEVANDTLSLLYVPEGMVIKQDFTLPSQLIPNETATSSAFVYAEKRGRYELEVGVVGDGVPGDVATLVLETRKQLPPWLDLPDIGPDSPLYGLKRFLEEASQYFRFDDAKKAEKQVEYAERRLAEAYMSGDGALLEEYEREMEKAKELQLLAQRKGADTSELDKEMEEKAEQHEEALYDLEAPEELIRAVQDLLEEVSEEEIKNVGEDVVEDAEEQVERAEEQAEDVVEEFVEEPAEEVIEETGDIVEEISRETGIDEEVVEEIIEQVENLTEDDINEVIEDVKNQLPELPIN